MCWGCSAEEVAWEEAWESWCGGGRTPFGPSHLPHPYTDQKDNQKSSRIPPRTYSWCKINANEAGPSLGRPGPEVALVGVALAADGNGDGSGSRSKNKFRCLMCARHGLGTLHALTNLPQASQPPLQLTHLFPL